MKKPVNAGKFLFTLYLICGILNRPYKKGGPPVDYVSHSEAETEALGRRLAAVLAPRGRCLLYQ